LASRELHIDIRYHYVRELIGKEVELEYVPSCENAADLLTKVLPLSMFKYLRDKLGLKQMDCNSVGALDGAGIAMEPYGIFHTPSFAHRVFSPAYCLLTHLRIYDFISPISDAKSSYKFWKYLLL
jgi:hypothetical protein